MGVNARMIIKAAVQMEKHALRLSKKAAKAKDTARKADRKAGKAAQKAYKVAKAAKKKKVLGMLVAPQEDDSESEEDWNVWDIADLPKEAEKAREIARKAAMKAHKMAQKADQLAEKAYPVWKAANKQMLGAWECLQTKPQEDLSEQDWEDYHLRQDWYDEFLATRKTRRLSVQEKKKQ
jgi:hypothetical protein